MRELCEGRRLQENHAVDAGHSRVGPPPLPKSGLPPGGREGQLPVRKKPDVPNLGSGFNGERLAEEARALSVSKNAGRRGRYESVKLRWTGFRSGRPVSGRAAFFHR